MSELTLSENLKAYLQIFEEKLQTLRSVNVDEGEARNRSEQEAANKYPLGEQDKSLIKYTLREHLMQKHSCATTEELEAKLQEFRRNSETVGQTFDHARMIDDTEGSQRLGMLMEEYDYQANEIERTLDTELIDGRIMLSFLRLVKPSVR